MPTIDGFHPHDRDAFQGFSDAKAEKIFATIAGLARRLHVEVHGLHKIPEGRAMIVGNHTFGWDPIFPMAEVWRTLHRPMFVLGEHVWWKFPFLRRMAAAVGTVDGTQENTDRLLEHDELVLVLPGGLRESVKPRELRYRLLWGNRYGFVRAAIRNRAPFVPLAAIGADDLFDLVGNAYARGARWLHRGDIPIPLPRHVHKAHLRFVFGDPIAIRVPPEAASEDDIVRSIRHEVEGELHELIETELARRAGIYFE